MKYIIYNIFESYKHIPYTWKHYLTFLATEKKIIGYYKYIFHDIDKLFMYILLPFLGKRRIGQIHQKYQKHHPIYTIGKGKIKQFKSPSSVNWEEAIIDWECAKISKPDKPLNARDTMEKFYPEYREIVEVYLRKMKL